MMALIEWWAGLPWLVRYGVAALVLAASTLLLFVGGSARLPVMGWALGGAMVVLSGRSDSEKRGYRF